MYDLAILGAGPAGSTLARLIGGAYRVLMVDRRPLDLTDGGGAEKNCGGLLAPDAQAALARLRLGVPHQVLCGPQLFTVRTIDLATGRERYYQRFYINTDRQRFDRWLLSLLPAGVEFRGGWRCVGFDREEGAFRLHLVDCKTGRIDTERARLLVGCDGAASLVRRRFFAGRPLPRRYIAVQEWFEQGTEPLPHYGVFFDPGLTDFYAWTIPKENRLLLGAALDPGPGVKEKFDLLKEKLRRFGLRLDRPLRRQAALLFRPGSGSEICLGNQAIALAGEAAGFISPSSAEGISFALLSARALALALRQGPEGFLSRYRLLAAGLSLKVLLKVCKAPFFYRPWLRSLIMRSGLTSMEVDGTAPSRPDYED